MHDFCALSTGLKSIFVEISESFSESTFEKIGGYPQLKGRSKATNSQRRVAQNNYEL